MKAVIPGDYFWKKPAEFTRWRVIFLLAAWLLILSSEPAFALPPGNWTQTFSEDFNGTSLDTTKWSTGYLWSAVINNELEGMRSENVTVSNGICTIKVEKRACNNQAFQNQFEWASGSQYASGCITTFNKFTQTYGYFEARIQTPTCKGAWPAFWMLPDRGPVYGGAFVDNTGTRSAFNVLGQPRGNEIDILESFGSWKRADNTAKAHSGFIWNYKGGALADYDRANNGLGDTLYFPNPDAEWHTYGVYWAPGIIATYLDDQMVNYWTNPNVADCPQYIILNCAVALNDWTGTNLSTAQIDAGLPSSMKIDWVHAYSGAPAIIKPVTSSWVGRDISNSSILQGSSTVSGTSCKITAEGAWDWNTTDDFRFTFQSLTGDGTIIAKVSRLDNVGSSAGSAGLMIRESMDADARKASLTVSAGYGNVSFNARAAAGANSTGTTLPFFQYVPLWMKLVRTGNVFTAFTSTDGITWGTIGSSTVAMDSTVYIGLAATSHVANTLTTAVFDNITIIGNSGSTEAPPPPLPPSPGTPGPVNLALNKPVTTSSVQMLGLEPTKAVDGSLMTRWSSAFSDSQWISVDLGVPTTITGVTLNWEAAYGKSYQIQVSNDAVAWTTVYATTTGTGGVNTLTGFTGNGRYVRMLGIQRGTVFGYSLFEFAVFGTATIAPGPISVVNSGFESGTLSGWSTAASSGYGSGASVVNNLTNQSATYPSFSNPLPGTAGGTYYASITGYDGNPAEIIYQDVTTNGQGNATLQPNTTYILTVAIGEGRYSFPNNGYIALVNGTNPSGTVLASANLSTLGFSNYANAFKDLTLTFTTGATVSGDLTIEFGTTHGYPTGAGFIGVDNVRLIKR